MKKVLNLPFIKNFLRFFQSAELEFTAVAVAYYLLISILPIFMLLASLLPYLQINAGDVLKVLQTVLPDQLYNSVAGIVSSILTQPSSGWIGVSIVTTLWTFSQSISVLQKAINKAYGMTDHRGMILSRIVGIIVGLILQFALIVTTLVATFGPTLVHLLHEHIPFDNDLYYTLLDLTLPATLGSLVAVLLFVYYLLPNVKIRKFRYILPGTIFVVVTLSTVSRLFSIYVSNFINRFSEFRFVSFFVVLVIMLWFIFITNVVIIGAIINASFQGIYEPEFQTRRSSVSAIVSKFSKKKGSGKELSQAKKSSSSHPRKVD
ncbi:YihY/virulence factor BrkB family protein [Streptococcus caprae]|uniref:YihY/virulence factor BrkB family protein n=1 Tax=Streptococcus caprae TaxID=1640501 RepID=A0ABV8CTB0_9STRE